MNPNSSRSTDAELVTSLSDLLADLPDTLWAEGQVHPGVWESALLEPAHDILRRSGKGFRARLLAHSWTLAGGSPGGLPELLPVAIEVLHAGSLVIDDIEDDSSLRRGEPTLHRRYGLPLALNTGNWLYFLALAFFSRLPLEAELRLALYEDVSVGLLRCHQGQALDISVPVTSLPRAEVGDVVSTTTRFKTGALMRLASVLGARAAGASPGVVEVIGEFGTEVGIGLQMLDDWTGLTVQARREKGIEDIRLARPTWPWAWLAGRSDQLAYAKTVRKARDASLDWEHDQVRERLRSLLAHVAPDLIRAQLDAATAGLRAGLAAVRGAETEGRANVPHGLEVIEAELDTLSRAYG